MTDWEMTMLTNVSLLQLVPRALQIAFQEDPEFRQGLPLNYLNCTGVANTDNVRQFLFH